MVKRIKRLVVWGVLAVVLVLLVGGLVVYLNLNHIVKRTVETQASQSLNLQTQLNSADLSVFGGSLKLNDLQIASPQGFSGAPLLTLNGANVNVAYGQLRQDPIHIEKITLNKPQLLLEQSGGTLNVKKMVDGLPPSDPNAKPMKLVIGEMEVKDPVVVLKGMPLLGKDLTVPVPSFSLKNIGSGDGSENGAAVKDVVSQLVTALAANASNADALPPELRALLKGDVSAIAGQLTAEARKRLADALPGPVGQMVSGLMAPNTLKDPGKALGGLLGQGGAGSTTQPALDPAKVGQDALKGILGGKKKDKKSGQ